MDAVEIFRNLFNDATVINLEKNAVLALSRDCNSDDYKNICDALKVNGYTMYSEKSEADNLFSTYTGDDCVLNVSYTPFENTVRLIRDNGRLLPPSKVEFNDVCNPLITQVRNPYFVCDCGMTYVIRLADGRFVLIDGGEGEYDEIEHTMDILNEQNVLDGNPTIAAWFITHAHGDHFNGFTQIMDKYCDKIKVERLIYNWSVAELAGPTSPLGEFNRVVSSMDNTEIITARTGQVYSLAGTDFEILYACEDLYPDVIRTLNDTSIVFRMTMNGRRVMWLGDNMGQAAAYITKKYTADTLKCEILQVGHHGYWGGSQKFHEMLNPEVLLWPCPDFWYQEIKDWDCNRFFKESENIKYKFICGQKEVTLDMTKPVTGNNPYEKNGDIILDEDFNGGSVYHLNMSHITGGSTGYAPVNAEVLDKGMKFTAGNAKSLLELVQPGFVEGENKIILQFKGKVTAAGDVFGLVFNNAHPTVWNDIKLMKLDIEGDFEYIFEIDYENCKGALYNGKELIKNIEFVKQNRPCGIYLVMRNSQVILNKLSVKR